MVEPSKVSWNLRVLETPEQLMQVEELQRLIWPGSETDIVPLHILATAVHNGGLVIGAYLIRNDEPANLIGFVFGFPGLYFTPDGPRPKHCSHQLGVHPDYRNLGLGFALKRAQWQMVRHQGLDRITWTYDPLLSQNANLNITKLGGVCNVYKRELYGDMRDGLNAGLPSDRFQVDWWINSQRVYRRLSKRARPALDLAHFLAAGAMIINPTRIDSQGFPCPPDEPSGSLTEKHPLLLDVQAESDQETNSPVLLVEIPSDFSTIKDKDLQLALIWRNHTRVLFEELFSQGYLVTDFVYLQGTHSRSFYVLSHGESTF